MPDLQSSVDPLSIVRTHAAHQTILSDPFSATVSYYGWAYPGTLPADALWRIARVTENGAAKFLALEWASGNALYDKVWDNRLSYSYA